ncbi:MAG: P-II family nitrogen regulator [Bacillota bacterium]
MNKYSLIMIVVKRGFAETVMEAAKSQGAKGGTIIHARGTSSKETEMFLGINIEPEKDLVLVIIEDEKRKAVMRAINKKAGINLEGNALVFALPVDEVIGSINADKYEDD